jgi:hypothetical protein
MELNVTESVDGNPPTLEILSQLKGTYCIHCYTKFNPNIPVLFVTLKSGELIWWHRLYQCPARIAWGKLRKGYPQR